MRRAFTMIELVFAIVIIGILAAIAIPKFAATRDDALVAKARSDIATIRTVIKTERQARLLSSGDGSYITKLHSSGSMYFDGDGTRKLLDYGIAPKSGNGHWQSGASCSGSKCTYTFKINGGSVVFTYDNKKGTFDCDHTNANCKLLTE